MFFLQLNAVVDMVVLVIVIPSCNCVFSIAKVKISHIALGFFSLCL